ncbi:MAG: hypothetical protein HYW03_19520 [Deltaproteobacteria bacterium]|nr:hypothetical protein [Deltaproteobacteria bacterium]
MVGFLLTSMPRHPLSLVGIGLSLFSLFSIVFLLLIEATLGRGNPYLGILIYMIYPGLLLLGLFFVPIGALLERRRRARGGEVPPYPRIDLNIPRTRAVFVFVILSTMVLVGVISTLSYHA